MPAPRVFISSTHYDLKYLRSSLESFVRALGYDPLISEDGGIAYDPDVPLDVSCYANAAQCDIFVLIVGGRYGSPASDETCTNLEFYERFKSITRNEYQAAKNANIPRFVLVEHAVYAEYQTFIRNRNRRDVTYAHVDSVNIFDLIEDVTSPASRNPVYQFHSITNAIDWLRTQWAGLFKTLLRQRSEQTELRSLAVEITQLSESNKTLKRYLEEILRVSPGTSQKLIEAETERLKASEIEARFGANQFVMFLQRVTTLSAHDIERLVTEATSIGSLMDVMQAQIHMDDAEEFATLKQPPKQLVDDVNAARAILGLSTLPAS